MSSSIQQINIGQRKRIQNVPSHGQTKVSKANLVIEDELKTNLTKVTNLIKKEIIKRQDTKVLAPSWTDLFFRVKPVLQSKTYDLIREAATNSYILGIQYVAKQILKKPAYITTSDIDLIKEMSQRYNDQFWRRIQLIVYHSSVLEPGAKSPDSMVHFTVVNLCSEALAKATVQKTRAIT